MMKLRLAQPEVLIDINGITDLRYITKKGSTLHIGTLARHADLLNSTVAGEHFVILWDAERVIADPIVREWGTVGGSLCQADPSEDLSAAFAALKGTMVIAGQNDIREIPARHFHAGPYETCLGSGEMLTEIKIPVRPGPFGSAYLKVCRRAGDWPVGAAAAALWMERRPASGGPPVISDAGIGLTALGARNFVAAEAEEFLRGKPATEENLRQAGEIVAANCRPVTDQRGPEDYKRHLAGELTTRALRTAVGRATQDTVSQDTL
jgi:carbon-monoxide dehydrogenase medium subunit